MLPIRSAMSSTRLTIITTTTTISHIRQLICASNALRQPRHGLKATVFPTQFNHLIHANRSFGSATRVLFAPLAPSIEKELRELSDKFGEARFEIEDAKESAETIYFNEDTAAAKELVTEVLNEYQRILSSLEGKDLDSVRQSWGLKIEQLKGELTELEHMHSD